MPFYTIAILSVVAAGLIMWFVSIPSLIGYTIGLGLDTILVLSIVRKLGERAKHSKIASSLFHKATHFKASIYHIHQQGKTTTATVYGDAHDYADLMDILKGQMRFPVPMSKEAAKYAMDTAEDEPFEEKIRVALQYLGSDGHKNKTTSS